MDAARTTRREQAARELPLLHSEWRAGERRRAGRSRVSRDFPFHCAAERGAGTSDFTSRSKESIVNATRMDLITNIGIQLFTYDKSRSALSLFSALAEFSDESDKMKVVWKNHDGSKATRTVGRLVSDESAWVRLNDCYIQSPTKHLCVSLKHLGIREITVHVNFSPDCHVWAHSSKPTPSRRPGIRAVLSGVCNLERVTAYNKPEIVPSVLEITLRCKSRPIPEVLNPCRELLCRAWSRVACSDTFGTLDFGGEWLFFPTSGFNPNANTVEVFSSSVSAILTRRQWHRWRERHNVSCEPREDAGSVGGSITLVHSLEPRKSWVQQSRGE